METAPEKIYRTTTYLNNQRGQTKWKKQPVAGAENIEYIRSDISIEKAVEYILTHIPDMHILGNSCRMDEYIIDDFKKYMEE